MPVLPQRAELPLLPFRIPFGFVPASRGGVYIKSRYIEHGGLNSVFDQREELPFLPFGNPIGFVPASRGGVYIESKQHTHLRLESWMGMK